MSSKIKLVLMVAVLLGAFIPSVALSKNFQPYLGIGAGIVSADTGVTNITGSATLDEEDSGYKFFGGLRFNEFVAVEAFYTYLGEAVLKGNSGDTFVADSSTWVFLVNNASITTETSSLGLCGIFSLPIGKISRNERLNFLMPYVKLGLHSWDMDITVAGSGLSQLALADDGTDVTVGTGVNFEITDQFSLRTEYEYYYIDDKNGFVDSISSFSAAAIIKF